MTENLKGHLARRHGVYILGYDDIPLQGILSIHAVNGQRQRRKRGGSASGLVPPATVPAKRSMRTTQSETSTNITKRKALRLQQPPPCTQPYAIVATTIHPLAGPPGFAASPEYQTVVSPTSPAPHPHILPSLAARSWQLSYSLVSSCGHHCPGIVATIRAALRFPHSVTLRCVVLICCTKRSLIHRIELGEQARLDHEIGDGHRRLRLRKQLIHPQFPPHPFP